MPRAQKHKTAQDADLTDVDSDSDMDLNPVRLPPGLPLDDPPPQISADTRLEVEHVCRRHLNNKYIPMTVEEHGPDLSPKDSIKDAIILFACQDWSSTPSPSTQHARGRTTGWSCQRTLPFEQTDSNSPTSITL